MVKHILEMEDQRKRFYNKYRTFRPLTVQNKFIDHGSKFVRRVRLNFELEIVYSDQLLIRVNDVRIDLDMVEGESLRNNIYITE